MSHRPHIALGGLIALASHSAIACSGPGAPAAMSRATVVGLVALGASVILTLAIAARAVTSRTSLRWVAAGVAAVMCGLHPGIWISAYMGDCGGTRIVMSVVMVVLHAGLGFFALVGGRR